MVDLPGWKRSLVTRSLPGEADPFQPFNSKWVRVSIGVLMRTHSGGVVRKQDCRDVKDFSGLGASPLSDAPNPVRRSFYLDAPDKRDVR